MRGWVMRGTVGAATAAACIAGGAWAGNDAAEQVDGRYRATPELSYRQPAPTLIRADYPADTPDVVSAPPAGSIWGRDVGGDERAFFDTDAHGLPRDDPSPVRVHRRRVDPAPPPVAVEVAPTAGDSDGVEDGWVAPPADADTAPRAPVAD